MDNDVPLDVSGTYRCPGETYAIDRAVHLARLAAFYPACRHCECRRDVRWLSTLQQRQWAQLMRRASSGVQFDGESLHGDSPSVLDRGAVRRFATVLGSILWQARSTSPPSVLVGVDGHWTTAELMAEACETLQWAGCKAVELGAVTAPELAAVSVELHCDAALWIGHASGGTHSIAVKVWGADAQPWSAPGCLSAIAESFDKSIARPRRTGGRIERALSNARYMAPFEDLFHGLRPLRIVVETCSRRWLEHVQSLRANSACSLLRPSVAPGRASDESEVDPRLARLSAEVIREQAHLGLWVSGDGEACRLIDERGRCVSAEDVFLLLSSFVNDRPEGATVVVSRPASHHLCEALRSRGWRVASCEATREDVFAAAESHRALLAFGPDVQIWYGSEPRAADAMWTLCLLLKLLSQSDRTLSEVLDAAQAGEYNQVVGQRPDAATSTS